MIQRTLRAASRLPVYDSPAEAIPQRFRREFRFGVRRGSDVLELWKLQRNGDITPHDASRVGRRIVVKSSFYDHAEVLIISIGGSFPPVIFREQKMEMDAGLLCRSKKTAQGETKCYGFLERCRS